MRTASSSSCSTSSPQDIKQDVRNIVAAAAKRSAKPGKVGLSLSHSSSFKDNAALEKAAATFA